MQRNAVRLSIRRSATETAVQHALVRVEADALASALREARDERSRLERVREAAEAFLACSVPSERGSALHDARTTDAVLEVGDEAEWEAKQCEGALEMAIRRGEKNVNEVARQLKRTSSECGSWRVDVSRTVGQWQY